MNMKREDKKLVAKALLAAASKLEASAPVLYHGTTSEAVKKIMKSGLSVTSGWGGAGTEGVYLSNSPTGALMWAMSSLLSKEGEGGDPSRFFRRHKLEELALLEVRIPEDELANLKADMEQAEDYQYDGEEDDWQASLEQIGDVRFDKKIPASWLKVVSPQELEAAADKLGYDRPVIASSIDVGHDYDPSTDYDVVKPPKWASVVNTVLANSKDLLELLALPEPIIHYAKFEDDDHLAKYVDGTSSKPVIVFSIQLEKEAKRQRVSMSDAVEGTLYHELGHAFVDSSGMREELSEEEEEEMVEEFARTCGRGDPEFAVKMLRNALG